jgi:hypothetical protein
LVNYPTLPEIIFNLANGRRYIRDTSVGYQPYKLFILKSLDSITVEITMERGTFNEGAKVKTKINKGLFLWRKIVQNKAEMINSDLKLLL